MLPFFRSLVAVLVFLPIVACQQADKGPLEGAWKIVESSYTAPDTSWTRTSPQPSLYIFTKQHYSIMLVKGDQPRALFADRGFPTDAEKLAAYNSFLANSGAYEVTDSTFTPRQIVAKGPNFMAGEWFYTYVYQVRGDSLWLMRKSPPWAPEYRLTLVRLE